MISSITLKNVASYSESTLTTDKKVNLIYGLNGTGKSTLSNYLYNPQDDKYKDCSFKPAAEYEILVYNQKFVEDNFSIDLNGIFTLSTENKQAENKINKINKDIKGLNLDKETIKTKINRIKSEINSAIEKSKNTLTEKFWKETAPYRENHPLKFCLDGFHGSKDKLYEALTEGKFNKKSTTKPEITIDDLQKKWQNISDEQAQPISSLPYILFSSEIEKHELFSKQIVGNENSSVSDLITKLRNSDWVKDGLNNYLPENHNDCPFCQQPTITDDFRANLSNYFAGVYEQDLKKLEEFLATYKNSINEIPTKEFFENNSKYAIYKDRFESKHERLLRIINDNQNKIKEKIKLPSISLILENSEKSLVELNGVIESINKEITEHNDNLEKKDNLKKDIIRDFKLILHWKYASDIEHHNQFSKSKYKDFQPEENSLNDSLSQIECDLTQKETQLDEWREKTVNIDEAIQNINNDLRSLGMLDFKLTKVEGKYKIIRGEDGKDIFKSLSEGEKMMISFLYFIELCKGKKELKGIQKNKIIVIDDPISSLSHIYIFNVAQYIRHTFAHKDNNKLKYEQIFILTHSLYFFTELQKITTGEWASKIETENGKKIEIPIKKYHRLTKNQYNKSDFRDLKAKEILNNYQEYWSFVKDDNSPKALVANCMRHIIEHFFGFLGNDNGLSKIENSNPDEKEKFGAFFRYMNRGSHSDLSNLSHDVTEIDVKFWRDCLHNLFKKSGHENHYDKMMGQKKHYEKMMK